MRMNLTPGLKKITLKMDASDHLQHGLKMEGVTFGYKKFRCLSSQMIFDDKGLCYGFKLRSGNTHSVVDGPEMLYKTLSVIPNDVEKLFIADSAYSSMEMYNTCLNQRCNFIICLKENTWAPILKNNHSHLKWKKTTLKFFESKNCQTASTLYYPKGLAGGTNCLRVVFIRTKNLSPQKGDKHAYHYYAVVTDISESRMNNEKILKNYRKRSQVENNIKDLKNGMDFHHFPTGKLKANNVWGVAGIIAYNLMRYTSFQIAGEGGCFLKTTRRRLVLIAGEIITHARSIEIRLMNYIYEEVCRIKAMINFVSTTDANRLRPLDGVKT
jgi:transposase